MNNYELAEKGNIFEIPKKRDCAPQIKRVETL